MTTEKLNEAHEILDGLNNLVGSLEGAERGSTITIVKNGFTVGGWSLCENEGLAKEIRNIVIGYIDNAIKEKEKKFEAL